jgi:chromosome segregation ATPase
VQKQNDLEQLKNEIHDSEFFLETMRSKLTALRNSIQTRDFLGGLPLDYCPECLTRLTVAESNGTCKLCKETIDGSFGVVQARRMEQEIGFQISESTKILEIHKRVLLEKEAEYAAGQEALRQIQRQVDSAVTDVRTQNQERLDQLLESKGFVEGEIVQLRTFLEHAELYSKLQSRQEDLRKEIDYLRAFIHRVTREQEALKENINNRIKGEGTYLLNNDLDRQDDFKNANEFFIDFSNNIAYLSNKYSKYSASSNFYLKVSARFALFFASIQINGMRYPRFLFADNMEDKGIEKERAQNLQRIIINHLAKFSVDSYQLIYTTSYITDELNSSPFVVGDFYTKENPSLKNIKYK